MNDFEKELLSMMKDINTHLEKIDNRIDKIDNRLDNIEEQAEITRTAVNYNGEKLDELIQQLKETNVIA